MAVCPCRSTAIQLPPTAGKATENSPWAAESTREICKKVLASDRLAPTADDTGGDVQTLTPYSRVGCEGERVHDCQLAAAGKALPDSSCQLPNRKGPPQLFTAASVASGTERLLGES